MGWWNQQNPNHTSMTGEWDEQNTIENERKAEQGKAPVLNHLSDQDQSLPLLSFSGAVFPALISAFISAFIQPLFSLFCLVFRTFISVYVDGVEEVAECFQCGEQFRDAAGEE